MSRCTESVDPIGTRALHAALAFVACAAALGGGYAVTASLVGGATSAPAGVSVAHADAAASTPAPRPEGVVVHATGDVNLDPDQLGVLRESLGAPWTAVRDLFASDDVTIVNLECAAAHGGTAQEKEFTFRCDPGALAPMREGGVDVANLGNNHSGDFGPDALLDARANLSRAGVSPVGAGRNAAEANAPASFEVAGRKIAVLGFGGVVPTPAWIAGPNHAGVADGYDTASMVRAVRAADASADLVFVTIHWGAELDTQPRDDDVARARALIDAGADAIFGHHAHRLQPLDWYGGRPVFYGLGNFVWPAGGPTAVAEVVVSPEGEFKACLLPATIGGGRPSLTGPLSCA